MSGGLAVSPEVLQGSHQWGITDVTAGEIVVP